jgi:glycosyltransferase involved in cell wall biosynthesis
MAAEIVINARAAARPELGGVERWARELSARLPALRPDRYRVARPPAALAHRAGHAWEQGLLPAQARRAKALLNPANLAPVAFPRNVIVIHDAAALRNPAWYSSLYAAWQARVLPAVARRALHVVTVSEFSRREIVDLLGVPVERVSVVPGGVGPSFTPEARTAAERERPYVLCVASATARKNLAALGPAAAALGAEGVDVVVAGGGRPQFAAETGLDGLTLLGHVDDADLPGLYAGARAFVLPSLHEGFGLTAIEAMACGTPVVATRAGALPETTGGAARLVEPDPESIRDGLLSVVTDDHERARLRAAGLQRARAFTWERTVRELDALLSAVAP